jgi:hypothetical protein
MLQQGSGGFRPAPAQQRYHGRALPDGQAGGPEPLVGTRPPGEAALQSRPSSATESERQTEMFDITDADMDEAMKAITG